ncbi:hypothetical protein [Gilvimarinus chinensis]|uniref:hypothetical protein n=1 Tax=Gilvimarinus chinensis TaxID=396005 RepID=UPI000376C0C4|nr:hypothetical protein [Gilvimarinus chinensis]
MKFQCAKCSHIFTERTAICEDWRIKEKSFGCPSCKIFLRDPRKQGVGSALGGMAINQAVALIFVFLVFGVIWKLEEFTGVSQIYFYVPLLIVAGWYIYKNPAKPLMAKPYSD